MDGKLTIKCPKELKTLKVGVFSCLLDTELSFLWTSPYFLSSMGYTDIEFGSLYHNLHEFCNGFPEDFAAIQEALSQSREKGTTDIEVTIRLPLHTSGFSWFCLRGAIVERPAGSVPVLET